MGIDTQGGIIVGRYGCDIRYNEDEYDSLYDLVEEYDLESMADYYGADSDYVVYGIILKDRWSFKDFDKLKEEFAKAKKVLEPLFNTEVFLYGKQDVY